MQPKKLLVLIGLCICLTQVKAQKDDTPKQDVNNTSPANIVKFNLTGIALKNYTVQYERVLNRKVSLAISFRTMPSSTLPFKKHYCKKYKC